MPIHACINWLYDCMKHSIASLTVLAAESVILLERVLNSQLLRSDWQGAPRTAGRVLLCFLLNKTGMNLDLEYISK